MKMFVCLTCLLALAAFVALSSCSGDDDESDGDGGPDSDTDADSDSDADEYPADGVDVLIAMDNSGSMQEEQQILSTNAFTLVNALVNPLPDSPLPQPLDNMRVAVVSSDMGLSWGGNPYQDGDGWPGMAPCSAAGDNGAFQTYNSGNTIEIQDATIPCVEEGGQCPTDWTCGEIGESGMGVRLAPGDETVGCPDVDGDWASTPSDDLTSQVACLTSLGTNGCGFEQQLQSASVAVNTESQADFLRDGSLLTVIVVSDEEDCSIESNSLFGVPEIQDDIKINVSCGNNEEFLYDVDHFRETLLAAKGGNPNAVLFAAIVGVPMEHECQGQGDDIVECLDHPDMQYVEQPEGQQNYIFYKPACTRTENSNAVTVARPGRRFVKLAQEFEENGYVFSICNADWTSAMGDIARIIAEELAG